MYVESGRAAEGSRDFWNTFREFQRTRRGSLQKSQSPSFPNRRLRRRAPNALADATRRFGLLDSVLRSRGGFLSRHTYVSPTFQIQRNFLGAAKARRRARRGWRAPTPPTTRRDSCFANRLVPYVVSSPTMDDRWVKRWSKGPWLSRNTLHRTLSSLHTSLHQSQTCTEYCESKARRRTSACARDFFRVLDFEEKSG